jgi:hypothetical protein
MSNYLVYHELYEGIWVMKKGFTTLNKLEKIFHMFSCSIDCEILAQGRMKFKKSFKSYSKN